MRSIQSRFVYTMMKNRHLFQGKLRQEAWDFNTSIQAFRQVCEDGARRAGDVPEEVLVLPAHIDGLPEGLSAEWLVPADRADVDPAHEPVIFYTHGGGYVSGSCSDHRAMVAKVAKTSGVRVLLYEYRLAPEHPYPAALEDTLTAYRWMLEQGYSAENTVIMGESAGGGLCLATLLALRDKGLPMPVAGVALSPYTDLTLSGESHRTRASVCLSPPGMATVCSQYYVGEHARTLPYISPLFGDLHGLPPLMIVVGDYETLLDDATRFARKAEQAGVQVRLEIGEGMIHCYPLLAPLFPEATQALEEVSAFIRERLRHALAVIV